MSKIIVADDGQLIRKLLGDFLRKENHTVLEAEDGEKAIELFKKNPDTGLLILDIMMPEIDGWEVCRKIRRISDVPVMMLTARSQDFDQITGFEAGADDYVTKPFSPKEVMARVHAVLKRYGEEAANEVVTFEGLTIDMAGRNVYVDGEKVELTPKEYEILFYFVKNKGIALTREKLLMDVWGFDFYGDDRTVDTHIKMLRSNLKQYRKFIVTLRGLGYKFEV